jgi:hypothetical protein
MGVARSVAIRTSDAAGLRIARAAGLRPAPETIEGSLAQLDDRGVRVVLAFSDEEPLCWFLEDRRIPAMFGQWTRATYVRLPGRDHTVRPIVAQSAAQALLDDLADRASRETAAVEAMPGPAPLVVASTPPTAP